MSESHLDRLQRMARQAAAKARRSPPGPRTELVVVVYELDTESGHARTASMFASLPKRNRDVDQTLAQRLLDTIDRKLEGVVFHRLTPADGDAPLNDEQPAL